MMSVDQKLEMLRELLRSYGSCVVAYSGGVDSVFLAKVAWDVLGERSLAAIADSPSLPRAELEEAMEIGRRFGFPVRVVRTREFESAEYLANPMNRCFYCKQELFTELAPLASDGGFAVIVYGENASDTGDFRPGAQAAAAFAVRAPLKDAGLTKAEIRELSGRLGLPTADKAQMACLSSRIPYGERVTVAKLGMIESAERWLKGLGFFEVRVRHYELEGGAGAGGGPRFMARIEVGRDEVGRLMEAEMRGRVTDGLRALGYGEVTVDPEGYRRGSLNAARSLG